mmetsp:Transcript_28888/g.47306  ORF Transcript_28888/g.47306 Transcript_28888/m.47306 type:complete len:251 (+) Transcript_28888:7-759(+)
MDATVFGILVAVLVVLIASIVTYYRWSSSYSSSAPITTKHDRVLIYGPCGAGKTLLFYQLLHGRNQETQSSMQENVAVFAPRHAARKKQQFEFVDMCGHPSQQHRLRRYCTNITHVIFMIDSSDLQNIRNASKMLYHLLSMKAFVVIRPVPQILVACNKSDQPNADSIKGIQATLIKELNKLYGSTETLASVNDTGNADHDDQTVDIIKDATKINASKGFTWSDLKCNIDFATCSVLQKEIDAVLTFINA